MVPHPEGMLGHIYRTILMFAGGKRYLMRAPIRLWYELGWEATHDTNSFRAGSKSTGRKSSSRLGEFLYHLEKLGYIRRFPGGIEIMENQ